MLSSGYRKRQVRLGCPQGTPAAILGLIMPFVAYDLGDWPPFLDNPPPSAGTPV